MKTLDSFDFKNKKALIRVDFNVPLNEAFQVTDASRIEAAKPSIIKILGDGGAVVLMSHLGRPKGIEAKYSLQHIVPEVSKILGIEILFVSDCIGNKAEKAVNTLKPGQVLLLENLRFHSEEKAGDVAFAKKLSKLGDIYVNDAFGTAHRAHASTAVIAQFFPNTKCFGYLLEKEIRSIKKVLEASQKPVTAVLGGAKVSSKIGIIKNILNKVNHIIIGGGMTFTFIKALGGSIGNSLCEDDKLDLALEILEEAKAKGVKIHLPIDTVIADNFNNNAKTNVVPIAEIPDGWMGLDAGPKTNVGFSYIIANQKLYYGMVLLAFLKCQTLPKAP